jgi:tetratricopeptide (TPR) repeat protein
MKKILLSLVCVTVLAFACNKQPRQTPDVSALPQGAEALSLLGKPLYPANPSEAAVKQYAIARQESQENPRDADAHIWYGRRAGYIGKYREAIEIYTRGIEAFPEDARFYRHRGHRYITTRAFDRAIQDLKRAVALVHGKEDVIEPDGVPNARNTPVSSLHTNIWYHLGLAHYLKNDLDNALHAFRKGINASKNDDMLTATTHWLYMTLRRLGRQVEARQALDPIRAQMDVIENTAYLQLCLYYKGEITAEKLTGPQFSSIMNDAIAYGIGNWHLYNGQRNRAKEAFDGLLSQNGWASFGYIAAEADYAREFSNRGQ